jgi:hypothetical protein
VGIIQGMTPTNVDTFDVILNQDKKTATYSGQVGTLITTNPTDITPSNSLAFRIKTTNNDQAAPRNVIIYIEGCNSTTAVGSTTQSGLLCFSFI